ncbi:MAG: thioredoxin fold domain-containing protein, partial [Deltaproteobacteria bacterium]|nr:thioredoxin fold domain-containing protein [Deltaproteobacteria bacterium]
MKNFTISGKKTDPFLQIPDGKINIMEKPKAFRIFVTIILALTGIGLMVFYALCDTSCSYLQGDILGIDLKHIGIGYMLAIIILSAVRQMAYVRTLLALGIGVEIYLISYQFGEEVFCPFCLSFAAIVIIAFALNYEKPVVFKKSRLQQIVYGLGDIELSPLTKTRIPLLLFVFLGYLFVLLTFSGSTTPAYGAEKSLVPSYGSGPYELIVFTDYFCPPCQSVEADVDPALDDILSRKGVTVTFVDLPIHKETPLYTKYFLYATRKGQGYKDALHARRVLFSLAKNKTISDEASLSKALKERGIAFEPYDLKPVYQVFNKLIQEHKVRSTPTCVVKYSSTDIRTYTGTFQIRNGLAMLQAAQKS